MNPYGMNEWSTRRQFSGSSYVSSSIIWSPSDLYGEVHVYTHYTDSESGCERVIVPGSVFLHSL